MRDVFAPVDQVRPVLAGMRAMPVVNVHLTIATIDFDDWSNERDQSVSDALDLGVFIDGQSICELHQSSRSAGFRSMNGSGNVVDRHRRRNETLSLGIVHVDQTRIGQSCKTVSI